MRVLTTSVLWTVLALSGAAPARGDEGSNRLNGFLRDVVGFSKGDLDRLHGGNSLAKVVKTRYEREFTIVGVTRVEVSKELYLEHLSDLRLLRGRDGVMDLGVVSRPPRVGDFATLSLPETDLEDLRKFALGKGAVKLPEATFRKLEERVDWSGDATAEVNRILREMLRGRASAYLESGVEALDPYVDKNPPQSVAEGMERLIANSPHFYEYLPKLHDYLGSYPEGELENSTEILYWILEEFGMKPTLSLRHAITYDPQIGDSSDFVIVQTDLYASHYFQASCALMAWVEADLGGRGPATYVVWTQRHWFDGPLRGLNRSLANRNLRGWVRDVLDRQREALHAAARK